MDTNSPNLWLKNFPWPQPNCNKYDRGHAIVVGGPIISTGATKLAATSALRVGAGLVSVACDENSLPIYASTFTSVMTKLVTNADEFRNLLHSETVRGVLIGPGTGVTPRTREFTLTALNLKNPMVLDADALTCFVEMPTTLFSAIRSPCILTPHANEFGRIFPEFDLKKDNVLAAQRAAVVSHSIIVLKGTHSVIAAPDGRTVINTHASPFLATAGTGDVLAGLCLGLLTHGMEIFDAACAAVWIHAEAARLIGPGLISEDLPNFIPKVLSRLFETQNHKK